jgi:hypothetical protein
MQDTFCKDVKIHSVKMSGVHIIYIIIPTCL